MLSIRPQFQTSNFWTATFTLAKWSTFTSLMCHWVTPEGPHMFLFSLKKERTLTSKLIFSVDAPNCDFFSSSKGFATWNSETAQLSLYPTVILKKERFPTEKDSIDLKVWRACGGFFLFGDFWLFVEFHPPLFASRALLGKQTFYDTYLPKTNMSPGKLCLEDEMSFKNGPFLGTLVHFRGWDTSSERIHHRFG